MFFIILWPLPILITTLKLGVRGAFYCLFATEILIFILIGPIYNAFLTVPSFVGMTIGFCITKGYSRAKSLLLSVIISIVAFISNYFVALWVFDIDTMARFGKYMQKIQFDVAPYEWLFLGILLTGSVLFACINYFVGLSTKQRILLMKE